MAKNPELEKIRSQFFFYYRSYEELSKENFIVSENEYEKNPDTLIKGYPEEKTYPFGTFILYCINFLERLYSRIEYTKQSNTDLKPAKQWRQLKLMIASTIDEFFPETDESVLEYFSIFIQSNLDIILNEKSEEYRKIKNLLSYVDLCTLSQKACTVSELLNMCRLNAQIVNTGFKVLFDLFIQTTDNILSERALIEKFLEIKTEKNRFNFAISQISNEYETTNNSDIEPFTRCICNYYRLFSISDFIAVGLYEIFSHKKVIKRCKQCNLFFIPKNRSDEKYCNNELFQKIFKLEHSCKEMGKMECDMKRADSDVHRIYNSIRAMLYHKYTSSDKKVTEFIDQHHEKYIKYKNGEITKKEFIAWMDTYYIRGRKIKDKHFNAIEFWKKKLGDSKESDDINKE